MRDFWRNMTLRDCLLRSTAHREQQREYRQGLMEEELLRKVRHIVGRTTWDHDHAWAIHPEATYHFCNETLRRPFYDGPRWDVTTCRRHTLFLSQAAKPIKGIHRLIEALPLILRSYPDTQVYVAGHDFLRHDTLHDFLRYSTYARLVNRQIDRLGVRAHLHFTGPLDAEAMAEQYRRAHAFVCPSSIENSPNSLGEAQLVGCPVVASYVGGIPDMVRHEETGLLYRFSETEMLAAAVCRVFGDDRLAQKLSAGGTAAARLRHDGATNARRMLEIYHIVAKS